MLRRMRPILRKSQGLATGLRAGSNSFQRTISFPRPVITTQDKASQLVLRTQFSTKPPLQPKEIDREAEKKAGEKLIEPRPDEVSTVSSTIPIIEPSAPTDPSKDVDFGKGLRDDIDTVKETFALGNVPREAYTLGLAGTLPYLATSVATVFYSWDLNTQWPTDSALLNSFLVSKESAIHWLGILEPIQVGYGVVLISFLGAIHWGLEFAEKARDPVRTQFRYAVGVLAPLVAWPTTFMPIEWALTTQFLAFTALYFVDSRAMVRGWAPTWYQTYRFVLTAVVGGAILISLVSRTKIGENHARLSTPELKDLLRQGPDPRQEYHNWDKEEEEERQRLREEKKKQEEKKKEEQKSKEEEKKKPQEKDDRQNAKPSEKKDEKKDKKKEDKKDDSNKGSNKKEQQVSDEEGSNQDKKKDETGDQEHGRKNSEKAGK